MTEVTEEFALCEGLRYIAHCIQGGGIYSPSRDEFIVGAESLTQLSSFALKLANGELPNWIKWIQIQEDAKIAAKAATI